MKISELVASIDGWNKLIYIAVKERNMGGYIRVLHDKLVRYGMDVHRFNISNLWLKEIDTTIKFLRSNYLSDFYGLDKPHYLFIHKDIVGYERETILQHSVGMNTTVNYFQ